LGGCITIAGADLAVASLEWCTCLVNLLAGVHDNICKVPL